MWKKKNKKITLINKKKEFTWLHYIFFSEIKILHSRWLIKSKSNVLRSIDWLINNKDVHFSNENELKGKVKGGDV